MNCENKSENRTACIITGREWIRRARSRSILRRKKFKTRSPASWLRLGIAKGPRRPVRPWVQVAPRHLLHSNLRREHAIRWEHSVTHLSNRRSSVSIYPCKKLSYFFLSADETFLPTEIDSFDTWNRKIRIEFSILIIAIIDMRVKFQTRNSTFIGREET